MSGKTSKAAGKQKIENGTGAASSQEVASPVIAHGTGHEPSVTLPGHYTPVGSQPVSRVALLAGDALLTLESSGEVALSTSGSLDITAEHIAIESGPLTPAPSEPTFPQTDDVVALEVRAVPAGGFWRCGRFWPAEPVHVFASDDPEGDNAVNSEGLNMLVDCFISHADVARLKAEPMLIVNVIETVTEKP